MKFKKEILLDLMDCDKNESTEDGLKLINPGKWVSDGKYELRSYIFQFEDKLYAIHNNRCGSYHSDYYYGNEDWDNEVECEEVESYEVTVIKYRTKEVK